MSSSPRPIAHRAFTVLLACLLVGSVLAPIGAAQPAAAQSQITSCDFSQWLMGQCSPDSIETTSYGGDPAATQTTLHGMAVSEWESQQAIQTIMHNYGQDTPSIASLEARNAIATGYEQANTSSEADDMARKAIRDYYSQRQVNTLESFSKSQAQFAHIGNITNEDGVHDELLYPIAHTTLSGSLETHEFTGGLETREYTLANGSTHEYESAVMHFAAPDNSLDAEGSFNLSASTDENGDYPISSYSSLYVDGQVNVRDSYVGTSENLSSGLPGQMVFDFQTWDEILTDWDEQSATMISNYVDIAPELYAEMDAGNLDPNDLRGAEGMVRYLSGESNATEGDYRTALAYTLDTSNPNLTETSTMRVHIDGYTGLTWDNSTDETASREPIPTDPMNSTIEGLLFADGVESVASGETYQTNATDDKSFYVIEENGTQTTVIEGEITVESIYDSDGNEMDSADYDDPQYGTYNASEFVEYLNENEEVRNAIITDDDDSDGGGPIIPEDLFSDLGVGSGGALVGLVIVVVAAGVVAVVVFRRP